MGQEVERASRSGVPLLFAFIDVDGLKEVNDRDGHLAGDELLQKISTALRANLRPYDPLVRIGGDEFACALFDMGVDEAERRFADINAGLQGVSFTVGLTAVQAGDSVTDVIDRSDAIMRRKRPSRHPPTAPDSS